MTEAQFNLLFKMIKLVLKGIGIILISIRDIDNENSADICYKSFKSEVDKLNDC